MLAMAIGFVKQKKAPLKNPKGSIPFDTLTEEEVWLIKAVAIADAGRLEILSDEKEVYRIAEEYANGGIGLLHLEICEGAAGDYDKRLEEQLRKKLGETERGQ